VGGKLLKLNGTDLHTVHCSTVEKVWKTVMTNVYGSLKMSVMRDFEATAHEISQ
jgi:hypothetical protein